MKKALSLCLALIMVLALLPCATLAQAYVNVPPTQYYYSINTAADLYNFCRQLSNANPNYTRSYVQMESNIDLSAYTGTWFTGSFDGTFDGGGMTISNFHSDSGGLFDELGNCGVINDLTISDSSVSNDGPQQNVFSSYIVGAIANRCSGVIKNCNLVNTKVVGDCHALGGFVGQQTLQQDEGTSRGYAITDASVTAPHQDSYYMDDLNFKALGGILSCATDASCTIENSRKYITELGGSTQVGMTGGIVGKTDCGIIEDCLNEATVTGLRPGGILGVSQAGTMIRYCANYGKITLPEDVINMQVEEPNPDNLHPLTLARQALAEGAEMWKKASEYLLGAGGILGVMLEGGTYIQNCMNYGAVSSLFNIGGIVGYLLDPCSMIVNCGNDYKDGYDFYGTALRGVYNVGGLVGHLTASQSDGCRDHANMYAAMSSPGGAVIYNSYNAMPFRAAGQFRQSYDGGVAGGLVGLLDGDGNSPSIENCHNAAIPEEIELNSGSLAAAGSLVGWITGNVLPHIIHCFGAMNDRNAWNYSTNSYEPMMSAYADFFLIGWDGVGIQLSPNYYFDNSMYLMDQQVIRDFIDPSIILVCGGILIVEGIGSTNIYHAQYGALTNRYELMDEILAYVNTYQNTSLDFTDRYFELTAAMLPWYCADPTHVTPNIPNCPEYVIFHSGPAHFQPLPIEGPEPGAIFLAPQDPDVVAQDPNEPGAAVTHSLSLNGDVCVNYYVSIPAPDADCHMEFNVGNDTMTVPINLNLFITRDGVDLYRFSCPLNSSQTSMDVKATIWVTDFGYDGSQATWGPVFKDGFYGKMLDNYSVNRYLEEISENPNYQNNEPLMNLMRSISVYGYYANALLSTDPDFQPSVLFDATMIDGIDAGTLADYAAVTEDFGSAVTYYGSSLILRTTTAIHHYFTLAPGEDINDYAFRCNGEELTPEPNGSYYCIKIPDIESGNLGTLYQVEVYAPNISAPVSIWTYSGLSYAYKALTLYENGGNISDELANVARALYVYYTCADAYFN